MFKGLKLTISGLALIAGLFALEADAQKIRQKTYTPIFAPEAASYSLDQCRNGAVEDATNPDCIDLGGNLGWVNGNAGDSNAHWAESQFIAYRLRFSGISLGAHTLVLEYDIRENGKYAIDYLGGYNVTETDADPCSGVAGCVFGSGTNFLIPADPQVTGSINPNTGNPIVVAPDADRQMTIWGGTITSIVYNGPFTLDPNAAAQQRSITVTFNASVSNPVIAWGGHIAWRGNWGAGNSAAGINGSPYHMRVLSLDGAGGNQDRSLSASAVDASGAIIIRKQVETIDNSDASNQAFTFNASAFFPPTNQFQLVDNIPGSGTAAQESAAIFDAGGTTVVTVTETVPPSWTILNVDCDDVDSTQNGPGPTATIMVTGGEIVTCTFVNGLLDPTAAPASVTGRVLDAYGRGISSARMTLFNGTTGESKVVLTNTFGYYTFNDLPIGDFYVLTVEHRRYRFSNSSTSFTLDDNISGMDFQASR